MHAFSRDLLYIPRLSKLANRTEAPFQTGYVPDFFEKLVHAATCLLVPNNTSLKSMDLAFPRNHIHYWGDSASVEKNIRREALTARCLSMHILLTCWSQPNPRFFVVTSAPALRSCDRVTCFGYTALAGQSGVFCSNSFNFLPMIVANSWMKRADDRSDRSASLLCLIIAGSQEACTRQGSLEFGTDSGSFIFVQSCGLSFTTPQSESTMNINGSHPNPTPSLIASLAQAKLCGQDLSTQITRLGMWPVGSGAFTDIFKGIRKDPQSPEITLVAMKVFRVQGSEKQTLSDVIRRLERESRNWCKLQHDNILPYLGFCQCPDDGPPIALLSPFCEFGTVMNYIAQNPSVDRMKFVKDVVCGLKYLHGRDLVHSDLHKNNVLVDHNGKGRLSDFGRARMIGNEDDISSFLAGSAEYMAPELFPEDETPVDFTKMSDVYGFAILAFVICTGRKPFPPASHPGTTINRIVSGVRPPRDTRIFDDLWENLEACWMPEPNDRPAIDDVAQSLGL